MNINVNLIFILYSVVVLCVSAIFGMGRGANRSILRLILVVGCGACAFFTCGMVADFLMDLSINGKSITQIITEKLSGSGVDLSNVVLPLVVIIMKFIIYLAEFSLLQFISFIIIYPIFKIFVKKEKNKKALVGVIVGLLQGVVILVVICSPATYLTNTFSRMKDIDFSFTQTESGSENNVTSKIKDIAGLFDEYNDSTLGGIYNKPNSIFKSIFTTTNEEGDEITLDSQIESIVVISKIFNEFKEISNIEFEGNGINQDNVDKIVEILEKIEDIKGEHSEEALDAVNKILESVTDGLGDSISIDTSNLDITDIDFSKEAEVISELYALQENQEDANVEEIISTLSDSAIVYELLKTNEIVLDIDDAGTISDIQAEIDKIEDEDKKDALYKLFGITV